MIHFDKFVDEFFRKFSKTNKNDDKQSWLNFKTLFIEHVILLDTHTNKIQFRK